MLKKSFLKKIEAASGYKLTKVLKLKSGESFPEGASVTIKFLPNEPRKVELHGLRDTPIIISPSSLPSYFKGFKIPSPTTLNKWVSDGIAKTMTGKQCEPDGYGSDNSPSWLLALGLI